MVTPPAYARRAPGAGYECRSYADNDTLYFYNWTEYVPPGLLEQFLKTGIKIDLFDLRVERNHVCQTQNL